MKNKSRYIKKLARGESQKYIHVLSYIRISYYSLILSFVKMSELISTDD
ncbi:MAG TPA: hypothetical protein VG935_03775 [Patescibacteria group bacterium]|nr:hypothetical protein [Patescibacteria group bacterium]